MSTKYNGGANILNIVLVVFLVAVIAGSLIFGADSAKTITVVAETVETKISGNGIITVYSSPVVSESDGQVLYMVEDGRIIRRYENVAAVYRGEMTDEMKERLRLLNDKLAYTRSTNRFREEVFDDIGSLNKEINRLFAQISNQTAENDYRNVYEIKNQIVIYHKKVLAMKGLEVNDSPENEVSERITDIEQENNLEKTVYQSGIDGMFSSDTDNFDELINPDIAMSLTPSEYEKIYSEDVVKNTEIKQGGAFAKIINNFEWYLVCELSGEDIKDLEEGSRVGLRITGISDEQVDGNVAHISEEEKSKHVVVIKSTKNLDSVFTADKVDFEIIKKKTSGLKIPTSALIKKDGKEGVYVIKDGIYKFVETEVIFRDKNYCIITNNSSEYVPLSTNVILYDLVVTNPSVVKEGNIAGGAA